MVSLIPLLLIGNRNYVAVGSGASTAADIIFRDRQDRLQAPRRARVEQLRCGAWREDTGEHLRRVAGQGKCRGPAFSSRRLTWAHARIVAASPSGRAAKFPQSSTCPEMLRASSTSIPR